MRSKLVIFIGTCAASRAWSAIVGIKIGIIIIVIGGMAGLCILLGFLGRCLLLSFLHCLGLCLHLCDGGFDLLGKAATCLEELIAHAKGLCELSLVICIDSLSQSCGEEPQASEDVVRCIGGLRDALDDLLCLFLAVAILCP